MTTLPDVIGERMTVSHEAAGAVELRDVSKTFPLARGSVEALQELSLTIDPGTFLSVVGPSGCGKSTLLRIVAGLEEPTAGTVTIDGSDPHTLASRHELGVAFQDHALLPWLTVADNVALPYRLAGRDPDRERIAELLGLVGLRDFAGARPRQLSGGMRQRVAIARSIVLAPRLLLMDEPFGALDLVTRRVLNLEMQRLWSALGTTTLLITHSVEEAVLLGDRVLVMTARPGRVRSAFDVPLEHPRSREMTASTAFREIVARVSDDLDTVAGATGTAVEPGAG